MDNYSEKEILQLAIESGILDIGTIQKQIEMNQRKKYLKMHPYSIWEGKDGYWRTYLPDGNGRKQIKKKTEKAVNDIVVEYWKGTKSDSFKIRHEIWMDRQIKCGRSGNTISKYKSDYRRFFEGSSIEHMSVEQIDDEYISEFLLKLLSEKEIPYRALKGLFGYINGVLEKSVVDKVIKVNPCKYVDLPILRQYCTEKPRCGIKERTISDKDKQTLHKKLMYFEEIRPQHITKYAVELSMYTGMRSGELSALKWENVDFDSGVLTICNAEVFDREKKQYIVKGTKNNKIRYFPITGKIKDLLLRVKQAEIENGYLSEWVFSNGDGRIHAKAISSCASNLSKSKEFDRHTSIHELRRTLNSNLRCMGVSATVAGSLIGNTERVNEGNYTYDVVGMEQKLIYVEQAGIV